MIENYIRVSFRSLQSVKKVVVRITIVLTTLLFVTGAAYAQNSLGLGGSEQSIRPEGPFASVLFWIQQQQQVFYKAMTSSLIAMKTDPSNLLYLVGLSFAYGIFHAAGPGHGKAVISSYMLANEVAAKRGIFLSFTSAFLQGLTAIVVISIILLALRGTGIKSSSISSFLEIASYFLVMMLGIYLVWKKLIVSNSSHQHDANCGCGHQHAPDPRTLEGDPGIREALSAIAAVGVRPCTGAIIVLTFAFLNGLYLGGVLSTFAMSLGTGITVATLALMAVTAKNTALKLANLQDSMESIHRAIEIGGAILVFAIGLLLFSAAVGF
ncbi:MAG: nickel/cobalt transporter [Pseudomonadota bacterium]